jgi:hypothetical protein
MINRLLRALGGVLGLIGGGLAAIGAFAASFASSNPDTSLGLWRHHAPSELARLERRRAEGEGLALLSPEAGAVLSEAPLMEAPLVYAALRASEAGDRPQALKAAQAALTRSPRNLAARLIVAEDALLRGDAQAALIHLDRLITLDGPRTETYLDLIASLANSPGGDKVLQEGLAASPSWGDGVVRRINAAGGDMDRLLAFNALTPSTRPDLIARILEAQGADAAFIAWLSFLSPEDVSSFAWPYDGSFEGRPGLTPFNWTLTPSQAELIRGGGLYVSFIGRGRPRIAEQTMLLRPGSYRLTAIVSGEGRDSGGALGIALECRKGAEIAALKVTGLTDEPRPQSFNLIIPDEGCPAQTLILRGEPGEYPQRVRAEVASIKFEAATETGVTSEAPADGAAP